MPAEMLDIERTIDEIRRELGKTGKEPQTFGDPMDYDKGLWEWRKNITRLKQLESDWRPLFDRAKDVRRIRQQDYDLENLRRSGDLKNGDTILPRRTIEMNLRRIHSPYMNFVVSPRRAIVLDCVSDRKVKPEIIEKDYTDLARYKDYENSWFRLLDGGQLHGWASMLTMFDPSMPGHFRHKYLAFDRLIFPTKATDIQKCEYIVIFVDVTLSQLKGFIDSNDFSEEQVRKVAHAMSKSFDDEEVDDVVAIRLCMYKHEGVVYTVWYHPDCEDWLRKAKPLYMGKKTLESDMVETSFGPIHRPFQQYETSLPENWTMVRETEYPVDIYISYDNEEEQITLHQGRGFYDKQMQQAQTSIWSSFVNHLRKSSDVYSSPKNSKDSGEPEMLKRVQLIPGAYYNKAMEFWNLQPPSNIAIMASQALESESANDTNQTAFTVINRQDARKTKKELDLAERTQQSVNSVPMALWAAVYRSIHIRSFDIVMSRARQGELDDYFLPISAEQPEARAEQEQNKAYLLEQTYLLKSGGEVEILERQEKTERLQAFFPVIAQTPLRNVILKRIVELEFPEDAEEMKKVIDTALPEQALTNAAVTALAGLLQQFGQQLKPEQLQQITQIIEQAQASREVVQGA